MKKTVCELFAGVGGFRCGLNSIKKISDTQKKKNGIPFGLVSGNQVKKNNGPMIAIYIDLDKLWIWRVMIQLMWILPK